MCRREAVRRAPRILFWRDLMLRRKIRQFWVFRCSPRRSTTAQKAPKRASSGDSCAAFLGVHTGTVPTGTRQQKLTPPKHKTKPCLLGSRRVRVRWLFLRVGSCRCELSFRVGSCRLVSVRRVVFFPGSCWLGLSFLTRQQTGTNRHGTKL